jgi:hypothetical protein
MEEEEVLKVGVLLVSGGKTNPILTRQSKARQDKARQDRITQDQTR